MVAPRPRDTGTLVVGYAVPVPFAPEMTEISARRSGSALLSGGAVLLALGSVAVALVLAGHAPPAALLVFVLLAACGGPLCRAGYRMLRAGHHAEAGRARIAPPYAFRVESGDVHFPAWYGGRADSWVLSQTTAVRRRRWGREVLGPWGSRSSMPAAPTPRPSPRSSRAWASRSPRRSAAPPARSSRPASDRPVTIGCRAGDGP